jgi:murein DD-endopeptidase MepM/ murein hydrolase activator NlpD
MFTSRDVYWAPVVLRGAKGMKHAAVGRGIALMAAAAAVLILGGCSASSSRFDFPAFNLTSSGETASTVGTPPQQQADLTTTSSLPVPEESVYAHGQAPGRQGAVARADLPPVQSSPLPRPMPASYTPQPGSSPRVQNISYGGGWQARPRPQPAVERVAGEPTAGRKVKVGRGDTLSVLAKRYSVSVDAIKSANNLTDTRLTAGQELIIPGPGWSAEAPAAPSTTAAEVTAQGETYKVQRGDTPRGIANKFKITEKELIAANKLTRADRLQINQTLTIPSAKQETPAPEVAETSKPSELEAPAAVSPDIRTVKTTTIKAPDTVKPSETSPAPTQSVSDDKANAAKPTIAASDEVIGGGSPTKTAESKPADPKTPETKTAIATANASGTSTEQLPQPDPMSGNSFRWPVQGRIISEFGSKADGGHNDGIDLAVPQGTSVKAAENGVVAYAGDELKPYGNLILIRHSNNWVSAYAHNEELLVKRGDKVRRGQVIAKAGKTGAVSQPLVHFELRKGSRPIDPTKYMANAQASAD